MRAIDASARLKQLLGDRDVQLGERDYAPAAALVAWEAFCTAALEPADTPFESYGAVTDVSDHEAADLLLFEAGVYSAAGREARYGLSFTRQFSFQSNGEYAGMNAAALAIDFDGDDLHTWPTMQLWGYAGYRRDDVSDEHRPEIANWAGHVSSWARQLQATPAFQAFDQLQPVRIVVEQSDI